VAVVVERKQITVSGVADGPHVYPISAANILNYDVGFAAKEVRRSCPPGRFVDVRVCRVSRITILVNKVPETVRLKIEDFGSSTVSCTDRSLVKVVKCGRARLVEIGGVQVDKIVAGGLCCACEDMIRAVDHDNREIFNSVNSPAIVLWIDEWACRTPLKATREPTCISGS
jgi:hypothetical protein